ncbi:MAG: hypothetical protein LUH17_03960 [Acidaminococcaceae bacterium]|nr:hypothetical protein [Acidaminococcaceae bacterium]
MKLVMEKRLAPSSLMRLLVPVAAALAALVFCGIFFAVTGRDPFEVYYVMFSGALGSEYGISETIVKMIPLAMCGLGIAVAFRMQIWNIGAEGQFIWAPVRPAGCRSPFLSCLLMSCCRVCCFWELRMANSGVCWQAGSRPSGWSAS